MHKPLLSSWDTYFLVYGYFTNCLLWLLAFQCVISHLNHRVSVLPTLNITKSWVSLKKSWDCFKKDVGFFLLKMLLQFVFYLVSEPLGFICFTFSRFSSQVWIRTLRSKGSHVYFAVSWFNDLDPQEEIRESKRKTQELTGLYYLLSYWMTENFDTENKEYQEKMNRVSNFLYLFKFKQFKAFTLKSVRLWLHN